MASRIAHSTASQQQLEPAASRAANTRIASKKGWRDLAPAACTLALGGLLLAHLLGVAGILLSDDALAAGLRLFATLYFLGKPSPFVVSAVVCAITSICILHAWLAMRKFPAGYRQYRAARRCHDKRQHADSSLWWLQIWTGGALFLMATAHLYGMLGEPTNGAYETAAHIWSGGMWPLYLMLLFAAELHAAIGVYRLAGQRGWLAVTAADTLKGEQRVRHTLSAFFIALGLLSALAYLQIGRAHAENIGARFVPGTLASFCL